MNASSFRHAINAFLPSLCALHKLLLGQFADFVESFRQIETAALHLGDMNGPKLVKIRR